VEVAVHRRTTAVNETYARVIEAELQAETARRQSMEQRGLGVITTSGALLTLLLALLSARPFARLQEDAAAAGFLIASATLLGLAEAAGLAANLPLGYRFFGVDDLAEMVSESGWREGPGVAEWRIAQSRAAFVAVNRRKNRIKATFIRCALGFEVLALCAIAAALVSLAV
jgi:hypothetical protein